MATRQAVNNSRSTTPTSVPEITRIQVEGNDTVSFLYGTTPPYQYVRGMSQIMDQNPAYISYRYDTITISQVAGESFTFTVYSITDVGGNTFTALTSQDSSDVVLAKTQEIYRLLVTAIFKGCCECGNTEPECSIQYTYVQDNSGIFNGEFDMITSPNRIYFNYITGNNQNFTNFFPIIQDGSWVFIFSKTDPTSYAVLQLSSFIDGGTYAQFDYILLDGNGLPFVTGTQFCIDFTSVGGSLVQGWQDTLDINSVLNRDNTVDGAGYNFVFDNNDSFTINSGGGSIETDATGASLNAGSQQILVTGGYIDIITPGIGSASTGWVLSLTAAGHVEYTEAGTGTVTSVGLDMPSAFTVTNSPITTSGDILVTGAGTALEYINGLGELATLPVYTVENGLHTKESPADPLVFHLGGQLIEDTLIETTEVVSPGVVNEWQLAVRGSVDQDTQFPFGVANLGSGGVATFQDYGSGARPHASVEIVGDVDLLQPLLELNMEGNLPTADDTLLRLRYTGNPSLAMMTMDYQFRNNNPVVANSNFIGSRLSTEVINFVDGDEQTRFELQLVDGGTLSNKLELQGFGQLVLNEYGTSQFSDGTSNIDNDLEYVLAVDVNGKVFKKLSEGGGTVTEVSATGLLTTSPDPITTTGTVTSEMNSGFLVGRYDAGVGVFQEITIGSGLTLTGDTLSADGSVPVYSVANGLHPQESPFDDKVFHLGGNLIENTTIYNQGFDFTVERANNGIALTVNNLSTGVGTNQTAIQAFSNDGLAGDFYAGQDFYTIDEIEPIIKINRTTILPPDGEFNYNEIGSSIDFINPTVVGSFAIQIPYASRIASRWTASLNQGGFNPSFPIGRTEIWNYDGLSAQSLTATFNSGANFNGGKRSRGLVQFNQYGQGNFYGLLNPVYGLGVDDQGNILEVDLGGGGTYDGNQGVYKDTSLTNDTFQLGAPSGSQAGIAFSVDRYVDAADKFLQIEGANGATGSVLLKVIEGSATPVDTKASFISATNYKKYAGSFTGHFNSGLLAYSTADGGIALEANNASSANGLSAKFQCVNGKGIEVSSALKSTFQVNSGATSSIYPAIDIENLGGVVGNGLGVSVTMSPGADASGTIDVGVSLNTVISDIGTPSGNDSVVDFRVDTLNSGTVQQHTSFIGTGQLQLHEYTTSTAFSTSSGSSVGVLNVDNTGKVFVGTGGGGGTYDGDQGVYKDTTLTNDTFMLGAPIGSGNSIIFQVDREVFVGSNTFFLKGTGNDTSSPVIYVENTSSGGTAIYAKSDAGTAVSANANDAGTYGVFSSNKNGTGTYTESTNEYALYASTSSNVNTRIRSTFDQSSLLDMIKIERVGTGSILNNGGSAIATTLGLVVGSRISTVVTDDTIGEISLEFQTRKDTATAESTNMVLWGDGQLQLNEYTTSTSFAGASGASVGVLNVDNAGKVFVGTGGGGGIPFGTASGTDTYTATIGTATSYTDGDAYIVRFTTGNTDAATLDINAIGAKTLYRNNDGPLIGGDIFDGGEMLCIYNAVNDGFDCIGTSPNTLFAYITNAETSTISRGQAVYAFAGTGNRMTVKLAQANGDATSAQTIGFVFSSSIAANQKGIIIIQGYFTDLSLFPPSAGWLDGDAVYLSPTVAGGVTRVKPYAPNHLVYLGVVATASPGASGRMYVRVQNGYELSEIHDVDLISTPPVNNDVLVFDTSTTPDLWKPKSIATILGYTPAQRDTFTIRMGVGPAAPADSTTYYFGEAALNLSTVATLWDNKMAFACKLVGAQIMANNSTATATSEASTISVRINNTTDVLLSNAVVFTGVPPTSTSYTVTGLSQSIAANDELNIKWVTPAWATNPTNAQLVVTLYFERT
jgi:hypothetical protein